MKKLLSLVILTSSLVMTGAVAGEMATKKALTLDVAKEVAAAAAAHARENNWNVIIAIVGDAIQGGRTELVTLPNTMAFDGGYPLMFGDEFVGGIGVSGVTSTQDGYIAMAGADYLTSLAN